MIQSIKEYRANIGIEVANGLQTVLGGQYSASTIPGHRDDLVMVVVDYPERFTEEELRELRSFGDGVVYAMTKTEAVDKNQGSD